MFFYFCMSGLIIDLQKRVMILSDIHTWFPILQLLFLPLYLYLYISSLILWTGILWTGIDIAGT